MFPRAIDIYRVLPELMWCGFGLLAMLMQPFVRSRHLQKRLRHAVSPKTCRFRPDITGVSGQRI